MVRPYVSGATGFGAASAASPCPALTPCSSAAFFEVFVVLGVVPDVAADPGGAVTAARPGAARIGAATERVNRARHASLYVSVSAVIRPSATVMTTVPSAGLTTGPGRGAVSAPGRIRQ